MGHSVPEQIQIKGPYLDQQLPQHESFYPIGLKSARIEIPHGGSHYIDYEKNWFLLLQKRLYSNYIQTCFTLVKKFPLWGVSTLADFRPMQWAISLYREYYLVLSGLYVVVVFGLGKNLLFKSILGHCVWEN